MSEVKLNNVVKSFGPVQVIKGIDLEVRSGEFVVFVGPSGCGKSTLLRMIAGLESITSGNISIGGTVVNDLPPRARDIAMVPVGILIAVFQERVVGGLTAGGVRG
jgi:ABC-type sugar transport system ATPase subunit